MINLNKRFLYGLFATFLSSGFALAMEQGVLIASDDLQGLRDASNSSLSQKPIQVDIIMSRADGRSAAFYDHYVKQDEESSITIKEIFKNFKARELLPTIIKNPESSLAVTVVARIVGEKKTIDKALIIEEPTILSLLDSLE